MRHKKAHHVEEPNLIPFLNLLVILIPYMLLNAVFSEITALPPVSLPSSSAGGASSASSQDQSLVLDVILYKDRFYIRDRNGQQREPEKLIPSAIPIETYEDTDKEGKKVTRIKATTYAALKERLETIHHQYMPKASEIGLLMEKDTNYDMLIGTMDAVREDKTGHNLFNSITVQDAPPDEKAGGSK